MYIRNYASLSETILGPNNPVRICDEDSSRSCGDTQMAERDIYVRPQAKLPDYRSNQLNRIAVSLYIHSSARWGRRRGRDPYFVPEKETLTQYRIFYRAPSPLLLSSAVPQFFYVPYKCTSGLYTFSFLVHENVSHFNIKLKLDSDISKLCIFLT